MDTDCQLSILMGKPWLDAISAEFESGHPFVPGLFQHLNVLLAVIRGSDVVFSSNLVVSWQHFECLWCSIWVIKTFILSKVVFGFIVVRSSQMYRNFSFNSWILWLVEPDAECVGVSFERLVEL